MPIAVISGASLGALRSGRYATRSMTTLSVPQNAIAMNSVAITSGVVTYHSWVPFRPNQPLATVMVTIVPNMNTSPWAKLINSMMPYTSV